MVRIEVFPDPAALGREAARHLRASLELAVVQRGVAHLALTGGTTAGLLYRELVLEDADPALWSHVHLWWGDDRFVDSDNADSNLRLVRNSLLAVTGEADAYLGIPVPVDQVHPFRIDEALARGLDAAWCAEQYEAALRATLPADGRGVPMFDVVLLGVGADGHILSCFPGRPAPSECAAVPAPTTATPSVTRVSCSPRVVEAAREVLVLATGAGKAAILRRILDRDASSTELPAVTAVREGATWLLDAAAATELAPGTFTGPSPDSSGAT